VKNLDLWPLLEQLSIKTKKGQVIRLRKDDAFAWAQRAYVAKIEYDFNHEKPIRLIILKGRQLGLSTITEAVLFLWAFLFPGTNALVLSTERDDSNYLFSMTKRYWEMGPFRADFQTRYDREGYLEWKGLESSIIADTATKKDPGRGKTLRAVHCSEVARWPDGTIDVSGLTESVPEEPGTIVVLESTAEGVGGYYYETWMSACDPDSDSMFTPMFFPWFLHEEYANRNHQLTFADLDEDERDLLAQFPDHMTLAKLAWRRRKIASFGNLDKFHEEYPCTPEEAFLSTGSNVFDLPKLRLCYEPDVDCDRGFLFNDNGQMSFQPDPGGKLWVYQYPDPRKKRQYAVAIDPTLTLEGDPACIQVIDRATMEQVAVWHGHTDPKTLGNKVLELCYFYNMAMANTEIQGGGSNILTVLRDNNYPYIWFDRRPDRVRRSNATLAWSMSRGNKSWAVGTTQGLVKRLGVTIHHPATYYEMTQYILQEDGTWGPARRSGHDDCVTSLMVCIMTVVTESQTMDWDSVNESNLLSLRPGGPVGPGMPRLPNVGTPVMNAAGARFGVQDGGWSLVVENEIEDWL